MGFDSGAVSVDEKFARFGSKSFAINKITSVDVRSETKPASKGYLGLWAVSALCVIGAVQASEGQFFLLLVAAVAGYFGWVSYKKSEEVTTYRLFVVTAGSEAQAYETTDGIEIAALRTALEDAMAASA